MHKLIIASCLGVLLGFAAPPARADVGLTSAVAGAYFPRSVDADLHAIAHERVLQVSACDSCMNHDGMHAGTAEVLAYNSGYPDPIAEAILAWQGSSVHDGILSNRDYGRIGCAERTVGSKHWFVCVLATGGWTGRVGGGGGGGGTGGTGGTTAIPDTAMVPPH
jgi:hypothetical protein